MHWLHSTSDIMMTSRGCCYCGCGRHSCSIAGVAKSLLRADFVVKISISGIEISSIQCHALQDIVLHVLRHEGEPQCAKLLFSHTEALPMCWDLLQACVINMTSANFSMLVCELGITCGSHKHLLTCCTCLFLPIVKQQILAIRELQHLCQIFKQSLLVLRSLPMVDAHTESSQC